jgi:hypothetical protein
VSWISTFTGLLLVCNGISEPSLRQIHPVGIQLVSGIPNLRKGAASAGITAAIAAIDHDTLQRVWQELDYRLDVRRVTKGAHIEHL